MIFDFQTCNSTKSYLNCGPILLEKQTLKPIKMPKSYLLILTLLLISCKNEPSTPTPFEQLLTQAGTQFDILIKNGKIIDGSGTAAFKADLLINADTIAFIGKVDTNIISLTKTIDAKGKTITPGFIDTHAHGDPMTTPLFKNFLAMGVTTICLGQDGNSPKNYLSDWVENVEQQRLGVNIAMFVGHGTLRRTSGINFEKNPTVSQIKQQGDLLQTAFDKGAFGMSTGLEYTPGTFATDKELLPLAQVVGKNNGLIMSHIRNEDDNQVESAIQELLRQGQYCNVQVSHMKSVYGKGKERAKELLALLNTTQENEQTVTADVYPYTASYTGIGIVFPKWAKAPNDYKKVVKDRRSELLAFLKQKIIDRNGPSATLFGTAPYAGKTLAQVSKEQGLSYEKVLLGIGPNRASGAYFIMDDALQEEIITHPKVMICSDGSPSMRHPRGYGSFPKIIEEYVLKRKRLSLEEAIRKMTAFPAQTIGIKKRGVLKAGNFADLLIFSPEKIKANATYEKPHELAEGFEYVFVNGKALIEKELLNEKVGKKVGRILKK